MAITGNVFTLPENDFAVINILTTETYTFNLRSDGLFRNLDATNKIVLVTELAGDEVADIINGVDQDFHKCILNATDETLVKNFKKMYARANGGACLLQWIPFRQVGK